MVRSSPNVTQVTSLRNLTSDRHILLRRTLIKLSTVDPLFDYANSVAAVTVQYVPSGVVPDYTGLP